MTASCVQDSPSSSQVMQAFSGVLGFKARHSAARSWHHGPFSGLFVTASLPQYDCAVMGLFLFFSVIGRPSAASWDTMDHFVVFSVTARPTTGGWWHHETFSVLFVTVRSSAEWWWRHGPLCGVLSYCKACRSLMVTPWVYFCSFLSPWGLPRLDGDTMVLFLVFLSPWGLPRLMAVTCTIFWSFCHRKVCRGLWRWHSPFTGLFVTMRSAAAYGGGMDHFPVFMSPWGLPRLMAVAWTILWSFVTVRSSAGYGGGIDYFLVFLLPWGLPRLMAVAWTIFWSFCHREVCRGLWQWHGPFSGLFVTMRSAAAYGGGMDHFPVFMSPWGLPRLMAVAFTIYWSFCHRDVCRSLWQWHSPFSGLSVTMRSAAAYGGGMDHFPVFMSPWGLPRLMAVAFTIYWSFCHRDVCRSLWQWHSPFSGLSVTMRSAAAYGGGMDHFMVFLSPWGLPRVMAVALTIFWSFCYREVCRGGWRWHGLLSGLSVTMRSAAAYGVGMDHFLVFLSLWGLPRLMAVAWTIFWSLCHRDVCRGGWPWNGLFSGLSVTMRSAAAYGGGMDQFLVFLSPWGLPRLIAVAWTIFWSFCHLEVFRVLWRWHGAFFGLSVTMRSAAAYGSGMYHFLAFLSPCGLSRQMALGWTVFCLLEHIGDTMQHFSFFCPVRSSAARWWHHGTFSVFCHHEAFRSTMVTPWVYFCSFLSLRGFGEECRHYGSFSVYYLPPWGLLQHDGDTMDHFLVISVTARPTAER